MIADPHAATATRNMESITRDRVMEPLAGEHVVHRETIRVTLSGLTEPWELVFTRGRNYGGASGGRILVTLDGGLMDPLAGIAWSVEYGEPYVHHVWVDPDARGRGLSQVLFRGYRAQVFPRLVVKGPFTPGGRAAALRAGATIVDDE